MLELVNPPSVGAAGKVLTLKRLAGGLGARWQYGSEKERFPCWCMLIRLELVGPATACLMVDLERRDYLLQLLSCKLLLLMPPLLKGQVWWRWYCLSLITIRSVSDKVGDRELDLELDQHQFFFFFLRNIPSKGNAACPSCSISQVYKVLSVHAGSGKVQ